MPDQSNDTKKLVINGSIDATNNPSLLKIGSIVLPADTVIDFDLHNVLAMSNILDGVSVIQRISRDPYPINFEFTLREYTPVGTLNSDRTSTIFPQDQLDDIFQFIGLTKTVQKITNTYLNRIGIQEIVIESISPSTIRGSKNIPVQIKAYENVPGQTLIITP
jgi:hypothetical protein